MSSCIAVHTHARTHAHTHTNKVEVHYHSDTGETKSDHFPLVAQLYYIPQLHHCHPTNDNDPDSTDTKPTTQNCNNDCDNTPQTSHFQPGTPIPTKTCSTSSSTLHTLLLSSNRDFLPRYNHTRPHTSWLSSDYGESSYERFENLAHNTKPGTV